MPANYFTLRALVEEWSHWMPGTVIRDVYSQSKGELTIVVDRSAAVEHSIRICTQAPYRFMYSRPGQNRARKNTVSIVEEAIGHQIASISIAESDRIVSIALESGYSLRLDMYGPAANVYFLDQSDTVIDRFRKVGTGMGVVVPGPRETPFPDDATALSEKLVAGLGPLEKRLQRVYPFFDRKLSRECVYRFDPELLTGAPGPELNYKVLYSAIQGLLADLRRPSPRVYFADSRLVAISTIALRSMDQTEEKQFDTVSDAVQAYIRGVLTHKAFDARFRPLASALKQRHEKLVRRLERMRLELSSPSRADTYELYGHLLMSLPEEIRQGAESAVVDDAITGSGMITIPLDIRLTKIQNAEKYYDKARKTRQARETAATRTLALHEEEQKLATLVSGFLSLKSVEDMQQFMDKHGVAIKEAVSEGSNEAAAIPFRRFELGGGYEVWVGRNAAQNDLLTMKVARPYDYWLHARGVAGSHTLLRITNRKSKPPKAIFEIAASIAAYFSKARTSSLVPVTCTQKKYVRKPRKSSPGTVLVEREEVLMVRPVLPTT